MPGPHSHSFPVVPRPVLRGRSPALVALGVGLSALMGAVGCEPELADQEYYLVRPDLRRCISPICGGYFLRAVNQPATRCADGELADECYVATLDLGAIGRASGEPVALVRGRLEQSDFGELGGFGELRATEAWRAVSDAPPRGIFYRLRDNGIRCFTTPCFSTDADELHGDGHVTLSDLNLSGVDLSERARGDVAEALAQGSLVASGFASPASAPAPADAALVATQIYLPLGTGCDPDACGAVPITP